MVGRRWSHSDALPRHKATAKQVTGSWGGVRSAAAILDGPGEGVLSHQSDKVHPGRAACWEVGCKLPLHTLLEGTPRCLGSLSDGELL